MSGPGDLDALLVEFLGTEPPVSPEAFLAAHGESARLGAFLEQLRRVEAVRGALASPAVPRRGDFPGFRIDAELGAGSVGRVYAAFDETLEREVALKVLHDGRDGRQILAEARRAAPLVHPSIVTVHSVVETGSARGIVMERVDGRPLDEAARGQSFRDRARLLQRVAAGLEVAHRHGVVHRDLKPQNILVDASGQPKILDFGLARVASTAGAPEAFQGTPLHASPEQVRGEAPRPASDVFSFGTLMYLVLTDQQPFEKPSTEEVLSAIERCEPAFPRQLDPAVPEALQAICLACLSRDEASRPDAGQVVADLGRFLVGAATQIRPAAYSALLHARVRDQLQDIEAWRHHGLIARAEEDRLRVVLRRILADEDHWILDARRLTFAQSFLHAAVWSVVVAMVLLVWQGRDDFPAVLRWLLPGGFFALLLGCFGWQQRRRDWEPAAAFLAGAVLLVLPGTLALLGESGAWGDRPVGVTQLLPEPYSNQQVRVAALTGLALSVIGWVRVRFTSLAWTSALLLGGSWVAWWLPRGFLDWSTDVQALGCLPLVALEIPALQFERARRVRWATPFHGIALVTLVVGLDVVAEHGPTLHLLGVQGPTDAALADYSLAGNGLLFLLLMLVAERTHSLDLRRLSIWLELLVPVHLLGGLLRRAHQSESGWFEVALYLGAVALLLVLGPWRSRRRLLVGGLVGVFLGGHLLLQRGLVQPNPFLVLLASAGLGLAVLLAWRRQRAGISVHPGSGAATSGTEGDEPRRRFP